MSDIAIKVENLGKRYRLGVKADKKETLGGTFASWVKSPLANYHRLRSLSHFDDGETGDDVLWALKDVSFEVKQGEVLGIIGRNGAGKSTLLKILSRITPPTTGQITLNGRVASLLEVGTGFHPELTGRENVYLNGTILGMTKSEVDRKFDEIVDFSGIEKFIDTPVKRYSSGMNVRLAFSVAAHLEPELMLIDEVLAVGDAEFQKKCLGKMDDIANQGRTVLFVSHNIGAVRDLCTSGILLESGTITAMGAIRDVTNAYMERHQNSELSFPITTDVVNIHNFQVIQNGRQTNHIDGSHDFSVNVVFELLQKTPSFRLGIYLRTFLGTMIVRSFVEDWDPSLANLDPGIYQAQLNIPEAFIAPGQYIIQLHSSQYGVIDYLHKQKVEETVTVITPRGFNSAHLNEMINFSVLIKPGWQIKKNEIME